MILHVHLLRDRIVIMYILYRNRRHSCLGLSWQSLCIICKVSFLVSLHKRWIRTYRRRILGNILHRRILINWNCLVSLSRNINGICSPVAKFGMNSMCLCSKEYCIRTGLIKLMWSWSNIVSTTLRMYFVYDVEKIFKYAGLERYGNV